MSITAETGKLVKTTDFLIQGKTFVIGENWQFHSVDQTTEITS